MITHLIYPTIQMKEKTFCQHGMVDSIVLSKLIVGDGIGVSVAATWLVLG
jgi:hypothetical protein